MQQNMKTLKGSDYFLNKLFKLNFVAAINLKLGSISKWEFLSIWL